MISSMEAGIETKNIALSYDRRLVLRDVSLSLKRGKVIALLGPNGCGKTTLLKMINGLLRPSDGVVYVNGRDVAQLRQSKLARLIGHVPQVQRASFPFSVLDIVLTGRMPHLSVLAQPGPEDVEKATSALHMVGASHLASRPYTQISGGERQLVMIARALSQEPSFLLLDEPTSYLDFKNQVSVLKMISCIANDQGVTAIMTLHDPNHALMFSDEVVLLRKLQEGDGSVGNVVAAGESAQVMTPQNIRDAYGIEVEILVVGNRKFLLPL